MAKIGRYLSLVLVVLIGLLLQEMFVLLEKEDTPLKAAIEFSKAYFTLDRELMSKRLCSDYQASNIVDDYIYAIKKAAIEHGYNAGYYKSRLFDIKILVLQKSIDKAKVRLIAKKRKAINPVYEYIGRLFRIGQTYEVDEVIDLVKEKDQWKVCSKIFNPTT